MSSASLLHDGAMIRNKRSMIRCGFTRTGHNRRFVACTPPSFQTIDQWIGIKPKLSNNNNKKNATKNKKRRIVVSRKPPVTLTEKARSFFQTLLTTPPRPEIVGIMLDYHQSTSGQPRMVYAFRFVTAEDIDHSLDEAVPLWDEDINEDKAKINDQPHRSRQLYIHHNAFLKILGATLDVDIAKVTPILYDRQGYLLDPNA